MKDDGAESRAEKEREKTAAAASLQDSTHMAERVSKQGNLKTKSESSED